MIMITKFFPDAINKEKKMKKNKNNFVSSQLSNHDFVDGTGV